MTDVETLDAFGNSRAAAIFVDFFNNSNVCAYRHALCCQACTHVRVHELHLKFFKLLCIFVFYVSCLHIIHVQTIYILYLFSLLQILDVSSDAFQVLIPRKVPPIASMTVKNENNLQEAGSPVTRVTAKVKITLLSDADMKITPQEDVCSCTILM